MGVTSYLTFQIHRVNGLLGNDQARRLMMRAAEEHRAALAEWRVLVGEVPARLGRASTGARSASRPRRTAARSGPTRPMESVPHSEDNRAELAHSLLQRLQQLKSLGAGGESFPLLLDDALADVDPAAKPTLLELLMKASANQQVIYLTEDADVAVVGPGRDADRPAGHRRARRGPGRPAERPTALRRRRSNHIAV